MSQEIRILDEELLREFARVKSRIFKLDSHLEQLFDHFHAEIASIQKEINYLENKIREREDQKYAQNEESEVEVECCI